MMRSKATAALLKLKEMDRKYNTKKNEGKRVQSNVSTESSLEEASRNLSAKFKVIYDRSKSEDAEISSIIVGEEKNRVKVSPRVKMEVKIPSSLAKYDESLVSESLSSKKSSRVSPGKKSMSENYKNDEFEEKSDNSMVIESLKSVSYVESSSKRQDSISSVKLEVTRQGSGDFSGDNDEYRDSDVSEAISEVIKSINESLSRKSEGKFDVQESVMAEESITASNIEELIRVSGGRSEVISELSNVVNTISGDEQKSRYEDDTFEEPSSSSSGEGKLKKTSEEEDTRSTMISGVKQIKITPHKRTESIHEVVVDEDRSMNRGKEIVELVPPKIMQSTSECDIGLDEELSNYVRTSENMDEAIPISLLKQSKQITPMKRQSKRSRRQRKSSIENTEEKTDSSATSEHERLTERKEDNMEANASRQNGSSTSTQSVKNQEGHILQCEGNKEVCGDVAEGNIQVGNDEPEVVSSEGIFLSETPKKSDVTSTLRKLNKDAINAIVRKRRVHTERVVSSKSRHCKNCGNVVRLPPADVSRNLQAEESDDGSSLENVRMAKDCNQDQRKKEKRTKSKKISKSSKNRKTLNYGKVEGKQSRFDCRQAQRLRKNAAFLRLQQEREDIRNYLLELEHTRLEFGPGEQVASSQLSAIRPLEFPKIAAFMKPDLEDAMSKGKDGVAGVQERILMIRQWLKDQYVLYRDYSSLAQTVNSKYIPASLEDAKRTIRQLQRATIKSR
ncbi:PREDICTED: uncharacterized protein LOC108575645 [Habropoda laboriosa]|uniref:uncharacterized protein LOC108575645 n=1 Tax=Habropoda laboriosa TaxID=597456 RepID=UPI00083D758E|nr:PREDICTED: uncharacterized protein LOC108575645 [Habropoda laboriosa]